MKTDKAIDTKLDYNIQTLVRVILVGIRMACMLRCLGNDARCEVPDSSKGGALPHNFCTH